MKSTTIQEVISKLEGSQTAQFNALDIDVYHTPSCPGWSKTALDKAQKSLAHLHSYKTRPQKPRNWGDVGNAVHTALLEPDTFLARYTHLPETIEKKQKDGSLLTVKPTFAMTEGKALKEEAEAAGKTILGWDDWCDVQGMVAKALQHKYARDFILNGQGVAEASLFWRDPHTGVLCKTRPDRFREDGIVVEVKTTEDASPDSFWSTFKKLRYNVQAAFQMDGIREVTGSAPKYFVIIAIEKEHPYNVAVYTVEPEDIDEGRGQYRYNLEMIKSAETTGSWPGYPEEIQKLTRPNRAY